jgi:hypothetical protein
VLAVGLVLGVLADALFYGMPIGISFPVVILLVLMGLLALVITERTRITPANLWLILPLIFLSIMSAVRAAPMLRFLNIAGALALVGLLAHSLTDEPIFRLDFGRYTLALAESALMSSTIVPAALLIRNLADLSKSDRANLRSTRRVVTGLALAIPFLVIFTVLFASADQIFDSLVQRSLSHLSLPNIIGHVMLAATLSWLFMGGLAYALIQPRFWNGKPDDLPENEKPADEPKGLKGKLGTLEAAIVLYSVDALFAVFVAIQFAALFGGEAFLRHQGLTYSEYARRGFFELLTISLITLALVLVLEYVTDRHTKRARIIFLVGAGLMTLMTIVILGSAYFRMQLYEMAYGFTILRVYPHTFMIWLAVLFAYFLIFLLLNKTRYMATGVVAVSLGFIITMNLLNPDAFIVRQNIARYEAGEELDVTYLGTLSADAVPELVPLLYEYDGAFIGEVAPWLHFHLNQIDARAERAGWPSYHVSYARAQRVLEPNRSLLESFEAPTSRHDYRYLYPESDTY